MDVFVQPFLQRLEIPLLEFSGESADLFLCRLKELGGEEVSQRIGGEVAEASVAPMHILQAALGVVGGRYSKVFHHQFVPTAWHIGRLQPSYQKISLDLVAQADMQVVGHLVRFGADKGRRRVVESEMELIHRQVIEGSRKGFSELGEEKLPEGQAPARQVFPKAGLGLVDAEGNRRGAGGAVKLQAGGKALIVDAVAGLVQGREEGVLEIGFLETRGDAGIARPQAGGEGVGGNVDAAPGEIKADSLGQLAAENLLTGNGAGAIENRKVRLALGTGDLGR